MKSSPREFLAPLASAFACRVRPDNLSDYGEHFTAQVRCKADGVRLEAHASAASVLLDIRGIGQALVFSLNRGNGWYGRGKCIATIAATRVLIYPSYSDVAGFGATGVLAWIKDPRHAHQVAHLELRQREQVQIFRNGVTAKIGPHRATAALVERLIAFARSLPPEAPEEVLEGVATLPPALQPLSSFFASWAIGDDAERQDRVSRASQRRLQSVRSAVEPLLSAIDAYLEECAGSTLSPAAIRLGQLAELVAELRAREA